MKIVPNFKTEKIDATSTVDLSFTEAQKTGDVDYESGAVLVKENITETDKICITKVTEDHSDQVYEKRFGLFD